MKRLLIISLVLVCPFLAVLSASQQKPRRGRNGPPKIESFTSSVRTISVCEFSELFNKPEVDLLVNATDPDADELRYEYSTADGKILGEGKLVVWDLKDVPYGPHEVHVTVTDGKGGKVEAALTVTTEVSGTCDPPPPPCPVIKVSCPDEMDKSRPFVFSVVIEGEAEGYRPPTFYWKLNAGRIVKGQNSREIEANTYGANGFEKITATVQVGSADPSCINIASCSTKIIW